MKPFIFLSLLVFTLLTGVEPVWAQEDPDVVLNPRLNAVVGLGQIGAEGRDRAGGAAGGALIELGSEWHTLETGALLLRTGAGREASFALPMSAKFRVIDLAHQSWFIKAGAMTAFQSNGFDVLVGAGLGGRIALTPSLDLILDGTYHHGLMDSSTTEAGTNHVGGVLFLTGLSFRI